MFLCSFQVFYILLGIFLIIQPCYMLGSLQMNTLWGLPVHHHDELKVSQKPAEWQYHGTTTLAFTFTDVQNITSIIVAVDSRATISDYVSSRTVKKILPINDNIIATMAGGAADCSYWIRRIARQVKFMEEEYCCKLPVKSVAKLLASTLRKYRDAELSVGTMIAGIDNKVSKEGHAAKLYYVDSEGTCVSNSRFCVGSGSRFAYSILDSECLDGITIERAAHIAKMAIFHASKRDGYSGGYINVFHLNSTGCHHISRVDSRHMGSPVSQKLS